MSLVKHYTIKDLSEHAEYLGGKLLSEEYSGYKVHYRWVCHLGHVFTLTYNDVKTGKWCRSCGLASTKEEKLNFLRGLAKKAGGELLTTNYSNKEAALQFQCKSHGIFEMTSRKLIANYWCDSCNVTLDNYLQELKEIAQAKGGFLLDESYKGSKATYTWKCNNESHSPWQASASRILNGHWCKNCKYDNQAKKMLEESVHNIDELIIFAKRRGGILKDTDYLGMRHKYTWECEMGHQWKAAANNVVENLSWCPYCNTNNLTEALCRTILEQLLGCKLPRAYPVWLKNQEGHQLELDGYNEEKAIAFEYQGFHHYETGYRCDEEKLKKNKENDESKKRLCGNNGIKLIIIDNYKQKFSLNRLVSYIKNACKKHNVVVIDDARIIIDDALIPKSKKELQKINKIAEKKGGKLLSKSYLGNLSKLELECEKGHKFLMTPKNLKKGNWCQYCAGVAKKDIEWCKKLAANNGGYCLSFYYSNNREKMLWKCKVSGHPPWKAPADRISQGHWCPLCGNAKRSSIKIKIGAKTS